MATGMPHCPLLKPHRAGAAPNAVPAHNTRRERQDDDFTRDWR